MSDDNLPHETETDLATFRAFTDRIIAEMGINVIGAITFIAFFFFYGGAINVIKFAGYELASIDFPIGVATGVVGSLATLIYIISRKIVLRRRRSSKAKRLDR